MTEEDNERCESKYDYLHTKFLHCKKMFLTQNSWQTWNFTFERIQINNGRFDDPF